MPDMTVRTVILSMTLSGYMRETVKCYKHVIIFRMKNKREMPVFPGRE